MSFRHIQVGDILLGDGSAVSPEEYERRQAALKPEQRMLTDRLGAHYAEEAALLWAAHQVATSVTWLDTSPVDNP